VKEVGFEPRVKEWENYGESGESNVDRAIRCGKQEKASQM